MNGRLSADRCSPTCSPSQPSLGGKRNLRCVYGTYLEPVTELQSARESAKRHSKANLLFKTFLFRCYENVLSRLNHEALYPTRIRVGWLTGAESRVDRVDYGILAGEACRSTQACSMACRLIRDACYSVQLWDHASCTDI